MLSSRHTLIACCSVATCNPHQRTEAADSITNAAIHSVRFRTGSNALTTVPARWLTQPSPSAVKPSHVRPLGRQRQRHCPTTPSRASQTALPPTHYRHLHDAPTQPQLSHTTLPAAPSHPRHHLRTHPTCTQADSPSPSPPRPLPTHTYRQAVSSLSVRARCPTAASLLPDRRLRTHIDRQSHHCPSICTRGPPPHPTVASLLPPTASRHVVTVAAVVTAAAAVATISGCACDPPPPPQPTFLLRLQNHHRCCNLRLQRRLHPT